MMAYLNKIQEDEKKESPKNQIEVDKDKKARLPLLDFSTEELKNFQKIENSVSPNRKNSPTAEPDIEITFPKI